MRAYIRYGTTVYLGDDRVDVNADTGLRKNRQVEGEHAPKINRLGFRGPELRLPKPKGVLRAAFLGGSTTFCSELPKEQHTWPYLVIDGLRKKYPKTEFDYVNGSVPGYTAEHSLKNLNENIAALEPDLIIVYHATNDLARITRNLAAAQGIDRISLDVPSAPARYSLLWYLLEKNLRLWFAESRAADGDPRYQTPAEQAAKEFEKSIDALLQRANKSAKLVVLPAFSYQVRRTQSFAEQLRASEDGKDIHAVPWDKSDSLWL